MNIHEISGVKKYNMSERDYFDPNKHKNGVAKITIQFNCDWDDLPEKEQNERVPDRYVLKGVPIIVIEDSRPPGYNQQGKSITWNIPISIIKMMAIQINEQLLKQEQISLKGTKIILHIDPKKNAQRYRKSQAVFHLIDITSDDNIISHKEEKTDEGSNGDSNQPGKITRVVEELPNKRKPIKSRNSIKYMKLRGLLDRCYNNREFVESLSNNTIQKLLSTFSNTDKLNDRQKLSIRIIRSVERQKI